MPLDIQFYFYEAYVHEKQHHNQLSSGPYIFRPKNKDPLPIFEENKAKVFISNVVKEIHVTYTDFASIIVRLYNNTPIIEIDWIIGPVPIEDGIGKEIIIKYTTDLQNNKVFYTDSNGRQTMKRRLNERASWKYELKKPVIGNYYPVTSKIYIEDLDRNIRFAVFNDRPQGGSSLNEGEIELMVHRRLLSEESNAYMILNETTGDKGMVVRGKHYIYISTADKNINKIFEKKFAKEIQLSPQIMVSETEPDILLRYFLKYNNQFSALKVKLPTGIHLLTLESLGENTFLLRFENYLEKSDVGNRNTKKVNVTGLFENLDIIDVKESTLAANMWKGELNPLQWQTESRFLKSLNTNYGSDSEPEYSEDEDEEKTSFNWKEGIRLSPMQIRTFIVEYKFHM